MSVVVPCHDYGRFLAEAVASIQTQTRPADEIVIVDDGSTDDTDRVIDEITTALPNVKVVQRYPARGPAQTFNDGVTESTGDLVVILSADDRLSSRYLELMERALDDPAVSFAYACAHEFGAGSRVIPAPPFDRRELMTENHVNGSAMFRRAIFDAVGGFRTDFDDLGLEDWEFWVHCFEVGAVGRAVEGCWVEYRRHQSGSRNSMRRARVLRAHLRVWRLHPQVVRASDLVAWMGRSARRNLKGLLPAAGR